MNLEEYLDNKTLAHTTSANEELDEESIEWIRRFAEIEDNEDIEGRHVEADNILCELVEKYCPFGKEIVNKFNNLYKWYA